MPIEFFFGERESLVAKSQNYKKYVRSYLESIGFSQTTDSYIEGTLADMVFYNPVIAPGKQFVIEVKASQLSMKSGQLAKELIKYFKMWQSQDPENRFKFWLFIHGVKRAGVWKSIFSINNDLEVITKWCEWYNEKCCGEGESKLVREDIKDIAEFFAKSTVKVANNIALELAVLDKKESSSLEISRYAQKLFNIVNKRQSPIRIKSELITNVLPIILPKNYYVCLSIANNKREIYDSLKEKSIPPFLFSKEKDIITFSPFDENNPLLKFSKGSINIMKTKELQSDNPTLASHLVHIHLRRIIWNRGIWNDPKARTFYYPILNEEDVRLERSYTGNKIWVVKKFTHQEDTKYAKKGEINFFRHRGFELYTPTYWETSYIEINPKRYYTLNGKNPTFGKIRAKIDARFRKSAWDRSEYRLRLMKFWKYVLFNSKKGSLENELWFKEFKFGEFLAKTVSWSPKAIGRDQTRLWDFSGGF